MKNKTFSADVEKKLSIAEEREEKMKKAAEVTLINIKNGRTQVDCNANITSMHDVKQ